MNIKASCSISIILAGCGDPELCVGAYGLAIDNPPSDAVHLHAALDFEQEHVEIDCNAEPDLNTCRAQAGDWEIVFSLDLQGTTEIYPPLSIEISDSGEDRRIPRGEIVVRLTSDQRPDQFVEHRSNPTPNAYLSCEEAREVWELPDEWETTE